jgi:hypothetical protein
MSDTPRTPKLLPDCTNRLVRHWRLIFWTVTALTFLGAMILAGRWLASAISDEITGWWSEIEDPTERGCAYIATAILFHGIVMAFKKMSQERIKVDLEK